MTTPTNWRKTAFTMLTTLLAAAVAAPSVQAQTLAECDLSVHVQLTPHSLTIWDLVHRRPRETAFAADRYGTAFCVGEVAGRRVTGNARAVIDGEFMADPVCASGVGAGSLRLEWVESKSFPAIRFATLEGTFALDVGGLAWRQLGHLVDPHQQSTSFTGVLRFAPDDGPDCAADSGTITGHLVVGGSYARGPERPPARDPMSASSPTATPPAPATTQTTQPQAKKKKKKTRCKTVRSKKRYGKAKSSKAKRKKCVRRTRRGHRR